MQQNIDSNNPEFLAKMFTYHVFQKKAGDYHVNVVNVSGKTTYRKWKKQFDTLSRICMKYGIDGVEYVRYCITQQCINFYNVQKIVDSTMFQLYAEHLKIYEQHRKIYSWFIKSANFIVNECRSRGYCSCKEYLKRQILHNTLAEKVLSGRISIYYLASIKNIREIVSKMDQLNQDTFSTLIERADKLNSDVQDAFMAITSQKVNPMKFTDNLLKTTEK